MVYPHEEGKNECILRSAAPESDFDFRRRKKEEGKQSLMISLLRFPYWLFRTSIISSGSRGGEKKREDESVAKGEITIRCHPGNSFSVLEMRGKAKKRPG